MKRQFTEDDILCIVDGYTTIRLREHHGVKDARTSLGIAITRMKYGHPVGPCIVDVRRAIETLTKAVLCDMTSEIHGNQNVRISALYEMKSLNIHHERVVDELEQTQSVLLDEIHLAVSTIKEAGDVVKNYLIPSGLICMKVIEVSLYDISCHLDTL